MGYIYLLYNDEGKGYIGRTKNIGRRLRNHKSTYETSRSKLLGEWKCEILEEVDNDCLYDYERYYYDMYNEMFPNMLINKCRPLQTDKESIKIWKLNNPQRLNKNLENNRARGKKWRDKKREEKISLNSK